RSRSSKMQVDFEDYKKRTDDSEAGVAARRKNTVKLLTTNMYFWAHSSTSWKARNVKRVYLLALSLGIFLSGSLDQDYFRLSIFQIFHKFDVLVKGISMSRKIAAVITAITGERVVVGEAEL